MNIKDLGDILNVIMQFLAMPVAAIAAAGLIWKYYCRPKLTLRVAASDDVLQDEDVKHSALAKATSVIFFCSSTRPTEPAILPFPILIENTGRTCASNVKVTIRLRSSHAVRSRDDIVKMLKGKLACKISEDHRTATTTSLVINNSSMQRQASRVGENAEVIYNYERIHAGDCEIFDEILLYDPADQRQEADIFRNEMAIRERLRRHPRFITMFPIHIFAHAENTSKVSRRFLVIWVNMTREELGNGIQDKMLNDVYNISDLNGTYIKYPWEPGFRPSYVPCIVNKMTNYVDTKSKECLQIYDPAGAIFAIKTATEPAWDYLNLKHPQYLRVKKTVG